MLISTQANHTFTLAPITSTATLPRFNAESIATQTAVSRELINRVKSLWHQEVIQFYFELLTVALLFDVFTEHVNNCQPTCEDSLNFDCVLRQPKIASVSRFVMMMSLPRTSAAVHRPLQEWRGEVNMKLWTPWMQLYTTLWNLIL